MCDEMKKDLSAAESTQIDSMIWAQMQASALVGDSGDYGNRRR